MTIDPRDFLERKVQVTQIRIAVVLYAVAGAFMAQEIPVAREEHDDFWCDHLL